MKNHLFKVSAQFGIQLTTQVLFVSIKEALLQNLYFTIASPHNDGVNQRFVGTNALAGLLDHDTFSNIQGNRQELQRRSKVTTTFTRQDVSELLSMNFLVTEIYLAPFFGRQDAKLLDQTDFIRSKSLASLVDSLQ
jgi:hypothetical protein